MQLTDGDYNVVAMVTRELRAYNACLEQLKLRDGLRHILSISRLGNGHIQAEKPWKLIKGTPAEMYTHNMHTKSSKSHFICSLYISRLFLFVVQCPCWIVAEFVCQHRVPAVGAPAAVHAGDQCRDTETAQCTATGGRRGRRLCLYICSWRFSREKSVFVCENFFLFFLQQVSEGCDVLEDSFSAFMTSGHQIGEVSVES